MQEGGKIVLRTSKHRTGTAQEQVQIEVIDNGVGMDEETRRRCLEPFFTTKGERGTGLGLAMVYGVIRRHNAEIEIDSEPGRGTTFRMRFGLAKASESASSSVADEKVRKLRLLVVDDDPLIINSLHDALASQGHTVVTANGGQEAIKTFQEAAERNEGFAAVITDLGMPHVDGCRVASAVKTVSPETPVILLTGWGQKLLAEGTVPANVDHVISKPPRLRDLNQALARFSRRTGNPL
jgi:CheY-like chemotaxis protein